MEKLGNKLKANDVEEYEFRSNLLYTALIMEERDYAATLESHKSCIKKEKRRADDSEKIANFLINIEIRDKELERLKRVRKEKWKELSMKAFKEVRKQRMIMMALTKVKLINENLVHHLETKQRQIFSKERLRLKIRLKEQDEASLRLFEKK
jgi:hypothetical protein